MTNFIILSYAGCEIYIVNHGHGIYHLLWIEEVLPWKHQAASIYCVHTSLKFNMASCVILAMCSKLTLELWVRFGHPMATVRMCGDRKHYVHPILSG